MRKVQSFVSLRRLAARSIFSGALLVPGLAHAQGTVVVDNWLTFQTTSDDLMCDGTGTATLALAYEPAKIDLIFAIDESGSIGDDNFEILRNSVIDLVNEVDPDGTDAHIGIVKFSSVNTTAVAYGLNQPQNNAAIIQALETLPYDSGYTLTGKGVRLALDEFAMHARPDAAKVLVVLTDGNPYGPPSTAPTDINPCLYASQLEANQITTQIVGIGENWNPQPVRCLTPDPARLTFIADFQGLDLQPVIDAIPAAWQVSIWGDFGEGFDIVGQPQVSLGSVQFLDDAFVWSIDTLSRVNGPIELSFNYMHNASTTPAGGSLSLIEGASVDYARPLGMPSITTSLPDMVVPVTSCDTDGDGTPDDVDGCPNDGAKIEAGICGCGTSDSDSDSDGVADCVDLCPQDSNKVEAGICGCGVSDDDRDGDTTADCVDGCPDDVNKIDAGTCGCGIADTDSDNDSVEDCIDPCALDPYKVEPGICGCGTSDDDSDGDSVPDCNDLCPGDPDKAEGGSCGCGIADTDSDGDGVSDCQDACPEDGTKTEAGICGCGVSDIDSDGDETADCLDNCPNDASKQMPGVCGCGVSDADSDADGTADCNDACPADPDKTAPGACGCGIADSYPLWHVGLSVSVGQRVTYQGVNYSARQAHTVYDAAWTPTNTPALWYRLETCGDIAWHVGVSYTTGTIVSYNGKSYRCLQSHTAITGWFPSSTPALWSVQK